MPLLDPQLLADAHRHLTGSDEVLTKVIHEVGPCTLDRQTNRYRNLLRAIVSQQISTAAAKSVFIKLEAAVHSKTLNPEAVSRLTESDLRGAGLSSQKVRYVQDLTDHVLDKRLNLRSLHYKSDTEVIELLTDVKGIGEWTAQMFLMFSLGRPDVMPWGDLGIQVAIRNLYGLSELPNKVECLEISRPWRPYATIASWYLWRTLD
ncbi:DNA-3-methyladenine glycosylase family protein [Thalassoglobus sp.]|uniref:DNA-3-methyladenine glycosylase family protein n=1 Tax=Thalassoglobus sp. TaxID=2795869 RepID=UPI003AA977EE